MKNRNYKVCRENIFVGEVVKTDKVYRQSEDSLFLTTKAGKLTTSSWFSLRSMLFVPDDELYADDLLYQSPHYPALNITDDDLCLSLGNSAILVKDSFNLNELLEYFGYEKELSYEDIINIRKTFFSGHFAMDNCELFGWKETMAEDITFYVNGQKVSDPKKLEKLRNEYRRNQGLGHRSFSGIQDSVLSREYFDILDERGDNSLLDAIEWHERMNAFKPNRKEGKIKKLSRY